MWPEVQGHRCLVIGSAPSVSLPSPDTYDFTIAVSGAIALVTCPDIWMVNLYTIRANTRARLLTVEQYRNREAKRLVVLDHHRRTRQVPAWMGKHGIVAHTVTHLLRPERIWQLQKAGYTLSKTPSSGLMAVCFAFQSGAHSVRMVGFSTTPGHFYDGTAVRNHVTEDLALHAHLRGRHGDRLLGGFDVAA